MSGNYGRRLQALEQHYPPAISLEIRACAERLAAEAGVSADELIAGETGRTIADVLALVFDTITLETTNATICAEKSVMINIQKSWYWECTGLPVEAIISEQPDGTWHAGIHLDRVRNQIVVAPNRRRLDAVLANMIESDRLYGTPTPYMYAGADPRLHRRHIDS